MSDHSAQQGPAQRAIPPGDSSLAELDRDAQDLERLGYPQALRRTMGLFTSFALAFSMVGIAGGVFSLFSSVFLTVGGIGIWLWLLVLGGIMTIVLVYSHLAARLPITGYAYQWSSRLVNRHYGWFSGWNALVSFFIGTASLAVAIATVFAPDVWKVPTKADLVLFATVMIILAVILNIIGIKLASWVNNVGAYTELVGTVVVALVLVVGLFFFHHAQGPSILFQKGAVGGGAITVTAVGLAALLPIFLFLGWEGSADLAEETADPRAVAPRAMIRSVLIAGATAILVWVAFAMAIPGSIAGTVNQPKNPMLYIFQQHFGAAATDLLSVIVFMALFASLIANVAVATRMCYSLSRDNMLPGASLLAKVNATTRTPIYSTLLVGVIAVLFNFLSGALINKIASLVNVTYYLTYLLTMTAVLLALRSSRIPDAPARYFSLGVWLSPLAVVGLCWSVIVILDMTIPAVNHSVAAYVIGAELVGLLWYVLVLRSRINQGTAGARLAPVDGRP